MPTPSMVRPMPHRDHEPFILNYTLEPGAQFSKPQHPGDVGYDLHAYRPPASTEIRLDRLGQVVTIRTGLRIEFPFGFEAQVRPRSSMNKRGLLVSLGTIDAGYRGDVSVIVTRVGWNMALPDPQAPIRHGDRIAQLVFSRAEFPVCRHVPGLSSSARGERGFGSTGR
ncbi:MAG: dUTP diphosphatase [Myxococcales bacterium FL481]|nr:MAG: dUTP diphosphatase [Myxococcales bacterium FL481]